MTKQEDKLEVVDKERLRQQLRTEKDPKAIKRLTTALFYLNGVSAADIIETFEIHVQTIYNCLDVVAERNLNPLGDAPRQPPASKLTPEQWESPDCGAARTADRSWLRRSRMGAELVHHYIRETFDVEYSFAHMYRVMKHEFGKKLVIGLDNHPYFITTDLPTSLTGTESIRTVLEATSKTAGKSAVSHRHSHCTVSQNLPSKPRTAFNL